MYYGYLIYVGQWDSIKRSVRLRLAQRQCERYSAPYTEICFENQPIWFSSSIPGPWVTLSSQIGDGGYPDVAPIFLHARYTPSGEKQLIWFGIVPSRPGKALPEDGRTWLLRPKKFSIRSDNVSAWCYRLPTRFVPFLVPDGKLRLYAGQPDPNDKCAFTVNYEVNGKGGVLRARLRDDDNLELTPSVPLNEGLLDFETWAHQRQRQRQKPTTN